MKLEAFAALFSLLAAANAHEGAFGRHAAIAHKRQAPTSAGASAPAASSSQASGSVAATPVASSPATAANTATPTVTTLPTTGSGSAQTAADGIPPLSEITSGMPTGTVWSATTSYTAGASPSALKGAPALPTACRLIHLIFVILVVMPLDSCLQYRRLAPYGQDSSYWYALLFIVSWQLAV